MHISVTVPKWGFSKGEYYFDIKNRVIAKGLSSIKYMSGNTAEELYDLARKRTYTHFIDVLEAIENESSLNSRQLDILIKIDFFSAFGNQRELLRITEAFTGIFNSGNAKKINKDKVDGTRLEPIVKKYAIGTTKSGGEAKSYTLLDIGSVMREAEDAIKDIHMEDLSDTLKVQNFYDVMGYFGYISGKAEDRRKLYVYDVFPLHRKKDGKLFGHKIRTKSIGSGIESSFTVFNRVFDKDPIKKNDIIYCHSYTEEEGGYYRLDKYSHIF